MTYYGRGTKSKKENDLDDARASARELQAKITTRQKKILSRQFIRDADLHVMQTEKAALEGDIRELGKLMRKINRMEDTLK